MSCDDPADFDISLDGGNDPAVEPRRGVVLVSIVAFEPSSAARRLRINPPTDYWSGLDESSVFLH
jgi:hypothetical protein